MVTWVAGNTVQRETQLLATPAEFSLLLLLFAEGSFYRASRLHLFQNEYLDFVLFSPRPFSPTSREIDETLQ